MLLPRPNNHGSKHLPIAPLRRAAISRLCAGGLVIPLLAAAVALAVQAGSPGYAAPAIPIYGVHSDIEPFTPPASRQREIQLMRDAGVTWVRLGMSWKAAEPVRGRYNEYYLSGLEAAIDEIRAAGMRVYLVVLVTPEWANPAGPNFPPLRMRDLGGFVGYAVRRFSSRVKHWEIWNEPDWHVFWKPAPDAAAFAEMLREAYVRGKAADPQAVFISGGLAGNNVEFLQQMYARGAGQYFDAVGVHPYVFQRSPDLVHPNTRHSFHGLGELRRVMVANKDSGKPIWITEMSWPTHRRAEGAIGDWAEGVGLETQAAYLVRAYEKIQAEFPFIPVATWYKIRDCGVDATYVGHNWGLVRHDFQPKPAYFAKQRLARQ